MVFVLMIVQSFYGIGWLFLSRFLNGGFGMLVSIFLGSILTIVCAPMRRLCFLVHLFPFLRLFSGDYHTAIFPLNAINIA